MLMQAAIVGFYVVKRLPSHETVEQLAAQAGVITPDTARSAAVALALVLTVLLAISAMGLLQLREGAWLTAVCLQGAPLAYALWRYALGDPPYFLMATCSFLVLALNQREVRHAFRQARERVQETPWR